MQDLEDAAAEWIVAPATSITLLNSFYTLFDFLPPSHPPTNNSTYTLTSTSSNAREHDRNIDIRPGGGERGQLSIPPPPEIPFEEEYSFQPPRTLTRRNKSMASLRSLGRKKKPPNLAKPDTNTLRPTTAINGAGNGYYSTHNSDLRPRTSAAASVSTNRTHTSHSRSHSNIGQKATKPPTFNEWSTVKLVEQYDPNDMEAASQPYAYVADYICEVRLSKGLKEEMELYEERRKREREESPASSPGYHAKGNSSSSMENGNGVGVRIGVAMPYDNAVSNGNGANRSSNLSLTPTSDPISPSTTSVRELRRKSRRANWLEKLRDGLQKDEEIGWFVVVCGDEERASPTDLAGSVAGEKSETGGKGRRSWGSGSISPQRTPRSAGFRSFFGRKKVVVDE